jgi:hypothetical protein
MMLLAEDGAPGRPGGRRGGGRPVRRWLAAGCCCLPGHQQSNQHTHSQITPRCLL